MSRKAHSSERSVRNAPGERPSERSVRTPPETGGILKGLSNGVLSSISPCRIRYHGPDMRVDARDAFLHGPRFGLSGLPKRGRGSFLKSYRMPFPAGTTARRSRSPTSSSDTPSEREGTDTKGNTDTRASSRRTESFGSANPCSCRLPDGLWSFAAISSPATWPTDESRSGQRDVW